MPLAHQIILGVMLAGFVFYPLLLFYGWIVTRGWEYGPDGVMPGLPAIAAEPAEEPAETIVHRKAA